MAMAEQGSTLAALMLLLGVTTATAQPAHPVTPAGAYEAMSPGNQHVARALHEAQSLGPTTAGRTRKLLSLEQIATMKQEGTGWAQILREMQKKGLLLKDKTLTEIVNRYNQTSRPMATSAHRATPKTNGDRVARGWHPDEALADPTTLEHDVRNDHPTE